MFICLSPVFSDGIMLLLYAYTYIHLYVYAFMCTYVYTYIYLYVYTFIASVNFIGCPAIYSALIADLVISIGLRLPSSSHLFANFLITSIESL